MQTDIIESACDLRKLRPDWERVYVSDPHAHAFLSWIRLQDRLKCGGRWLVLAVREKRTGVNIAFFASFETADGGERAGMICRPGADMRVIAELTRVLSARRWTKRRMRQFSGPAERLDAMLDKLPRTAAKFDGADPAAPAGGEIPARNICGLWASAQHHHLCGQRRLAETSLRQLLANAPGHFGARFALARILFEKASLTEAERLCRGLLPEASNPAPILSLLGDIQFATGRFDDAAASFAAILDGRPNCAEACLRHGKALWSAGRMAEAIKAYTSVRDMISDDASLEPFRSQARTSLDRLQPHSDTTTPAVPEIHPSGFPLTASPIADIAEKIGFTRSPFGLSDSMSELRLRADEPDADILVRTKH